MSTTTVHGTGTGRYERRIARSRSTGIRIGRLGIGTVGFLTVLISAWGGIIPFIGPTFGYSGDGTGSWHWSLAHAVLFLIPGAIGIVVGLLILAETRGLTVGRGRVSLTMAGFVAVLCGAWFVVGPFAWPVITTSAGYFAAAGSPLRILANVVGYSLGTGVILAGLGAFAIGWATRHQPMPNTIERQEVSEVAPATMAAPVAPVAEVAPVAQVAPAAPVAQATMAAPVAQVAPAAPMPVQEGTTVQQVPVATPMPAQDVPVAEPLDEGSPLPVPPDSLDYS